MIIILALLLTMGGKGFCSGEEHFFNRERNIGIKRPFEEWRGSSQRLLENVTGLLREGADVHQVKTHLAYSHFRALSGNVEAQTLVLDFVQDFFTNRLDIKYIELFGKIALHIAIRAGHLDVVKLLIEKGVGLDNVNGDGWGALHLAAKAGHLNVVKFALERGEDINHPNKRGWTALDLAAKAGHLYVAQFLLERGAIMPR